MDETYPMEQDPHRDLPKRSELGKRQSIHK